MTEPSPPEGRTQLNPSRPVRDENAQPGYLALREGLRQFIRRRVHPDHVDDLVQEVFLRMHLYASDLRDDERLAGWAFKIARNVIVDHHRRSRGGPVASVADVPDDLSVEPEDPASNRNVNEIVAGWLRPMIALLPTEYAEALESVELEGLTQQQYADRAGLSLSGAKSRVQRARKMLEGVVRVCCDLEQDARGNVIGYTRRADGCDESCGPDASSALDPSSPAVTCPGCAPRR